MSMKKWSDSRPPAGRYAYVNGRYLRHPHAGVHIEDRGLQLGEAVYEVCNVRGHRLIDEEPHLDRLERSLREIHVAMPMSRASLKLVLRELVARNRVADGLLYLQVSRGAAKRDHVPPPDMGRPSLIITLRPQDLAAAQARLEKGIAVVTQTDLRWERRDIKTTQLLPNLMAKITAKKLGAFEAWLVEADGTVTEGSSTNAWIVTESGDIVTRGLGHAILPGVTRRVILEAAAEAQVKIVERSFSVTEAQRAREAFISSATGACVPVISIDGVSIGDGKPGTLTRRLRELYAAKAGIKT
jgi:D-alanine transaminase